MTAGGRRKGAARPLLSPDDKPGSRDWPVLSARACRPVAPDGYLSASPILLMSYFEPPPKLVLATKAETLAYLASHTVGDLTFPDMYRVKSQWLCDELDAYQAQIGFPYNSLFQEWLEKREGLAPADQSGSVRSLLIYNAQQFRRSDALRRAGWSPLAQELIDQAGLRRAPIEVMAETVIGGDVVEQLTVRNVGGKLFAFRADRRKYAVCPEGQPARLGKIEARPPAPRQQEPDLLVLTAS